MSKKNEFIRFDWGVDKLLRNEENFGILEGFISEILKFEVKIKGIVPEEKPLVREPDIFYPLHLFVENQEGTLFIVEIRSDEREEQLQFLFILSAKLMQRFCPPRDYKRVGSVQKIYSINLIFFDLPNNDYVYVSNSSLQAMNGREEKEPFTSEELRAISMPNPNDILPTFYCLLTGNFDKEPSDGLDEWMYFLKTGEVYGKIPTKGLKKAAEIMRPSALTDADKLAYKRFLAARNAAVIE
jgi:hypothetical protein